MTLTGGSERPERSAKEQSALNASSAFPIQKNSKPFRQLYRPEPSVPKDKRFSIRYGSSVKNACTETFQRGLSVSGLLKGESVRMHLVRKTAGKRDRERFFFRREGCVPDLRNPVGNQSSDLRLQTSCHLHSVCLQPQERFCFFSGGRFTPLTLFLFFLNTLTFKVWSYYISLILKVNTLTIKLIENCGSLL